MKRRIRRCFVGPRQGASIERAPADCMGIQDHRHQNSAMNYVEVADGVGTAGAALLLSALSTATVVDM